MPNYYVEDYEFITGKKPAVEAPVEVKVVSAPETPQPQAQSVAEVK